MGAVCPEHEEVKEGDVALCRVNACALQDDCPYERNTKPNLNVIPESEVHGLLFCQGERGNFHKPIYFTTGGGHECPLCQSLRLGDARTRVQIRDGQIYFLRREVKRLKEVVLMNHKEMERLRRINQDGFGTVIRLNHQVNKEHELFLSTLDELHRREKDLKEERAFRNKTEQELDEINFWKNYR
jgi:hypothetical protein